ncbi:MAG: DnaB-like helicase C-terminal domain-containing protein [Bacteroidales bacterium]
MASRAAQLGTSVAFFSLEMSATQLVQRVLSTETRINSKKMQTGQMSAQDWVTLVNASDTLSKLQLWVDDTPSASILEVRAKARRQLRGVEPQKGLIIVDYLQLMQPQNTRTESRQVEIAEISRGLKILAKEMDMPIIALSQLSRAVESRQGKRPILSDLRESGAIEQDADIVMFLDRSLSEKEAEQEDRPALNTADVIVAKHRNGPTGVVSLAFQSEFTRFDNLARHEDNRY